MANNEAGHTRRMRRGMNASTALRTRSTHALNETGLRRVDWVRLVVDNGGVRAEAVGVGYRLPTTRSIPLPVAAALIAGGTPSVTRTLGLSVDAASPSPATTHSDARS